MTRGPLLNRFSSRRANLQAAFLSERLAGARSYKRIAGYFRSSIFELVGEALEEIPEVKVVCNSELDIRDIQLSKEVQERRLKEKLSATLEEGEALFMQERYRKLYELLSKGSLEIRVVPKERLFLHGKAGVIELKDGRKSSFLGSVNETRRAFQLNYELIWEDASEEAAAWVEEEFDALWQSAIPLPEAVIAEIKRLADRVEISFAECQERELPGAVFAESPLYRTGEELRPWQRAFIAHVLEHRERYGKARLLLADEVGLGKTLSLGASAALSALLGDGPVLILCPASLREQWQVELKDKLGVPSALWLTRKKAWQDTEGRLIPSGLSRCPCQIAIVSTGLITQQSVNKELLDCKFGMVILDEAHKARRKGGLTKERGPNNLLDFMLKIGRRTRHLLLGTATPIQTDVEELWGLMRVLDAGAGFVLGGDLSPWLEERELALSLIAGKSALTEAERAWELIRNPLPPRSEHFLFDRLRSDLEVGEGKSLCKNPFSSLSESLRRDLSDCLHEEEGGLSFFQRHNPVLRHTVLRQRKELEKRGLLPQVAVSIHPNASLPPGSYQGLPLSNHFFHRAYLAAEDFTALLRKRCPSAGLMKTLLLQRICSSFTSGLSTAKKLLERGELDEEELSGEELRDLSAITPEESEALRRLIEELSRPEAKDPKLRAIGYFLTGHQTEGKSWLEHGCILFSQYYDTALWTAEELASLLSGEPIALYAGAGKSRLYLGGKRQSVERERIKEAVKAREVRLVVATDAACEGLNLQTLGTLINIDLPWNPSRLEQRIGRIKRFGQARACVDMLNLVYKDTVDEKIYNVLSKRMQDRYDLFGSCPDVIEDRWIEDIRSFEEECEKYWSRRKEAENAFKLRYQSGFNPDRDRWELCERVLSRFDIEEKLSQPWRR